MTESTPKSTLVDKVYASIRNDIIENRLSPGDKIDIGEMSERYGVSPTPIKLALTRLISDNIIVNYPRQGMYVKTIQLDEILEILDIRLMLDLHYAKEIIVTVNSNGQLRKDLFDNVEAHLGLVSASDRSYSVEEYTRNYGYDYQFHEMLLKCSGNHKVLEIYHSINPFLYTHYIYNKQSKKKDIDGIREHQTMLEAIVREDEEGLKEVMRLHNVNSKKSIEHILKVDKML